jgi:hypothetical protein
MKQLVIIFATFAVPKWDRATGGYAIGLASEVALHGYRPLCESEEIRVD